MLFYLNLQNIKIHKTFRFIKISKHDCILDKKINILEIARKTLQAESDAITKTITLLNEDFTHVVNAIFNTKGRLIITGIGKSAHIGQKIVATFGQIAQQSFIDIAKIVAGSP